MHLKKVPFKYGFTNYRDTYFSWVMLAGLLFKIEKGTVPRWVKRLALKWKLVEPELALAKS